MSFRHSADMSNSPAIKVGSPPHMKTGSPPQSIGSKSATNAVMSMSAKPAYQNRNTCNNSTNSQRELGIIEKLLHSYGFIQCCHRDDRLFFHYSEYGGDADMMRTGELVEFQESADKRTGKPIAVAVVRVTNPKNAFEIISEEPVTGLVLAEAKAVKNNGSEGEAPCLMDGMGRVAYEQSGETFFLPFGLEDIDTPGAKIQTGDHIEFFISTDEKNGNIRARRIRLVKPAAGELHEGVVCSLKDHYGFIERADVVKEIFFHYSEFSEDISTLQLGDDVQFAIQTRNGKEVAVNVQKLPLGTVIFEDVAVEKKRGKILKTLKTNPAARQGEPLAGRIVYETLDGSIEIPYGDRDQIGEYTLLPGDIVEFYIATDRRDKLQRATNIALSEDTFLISKEKREKGYVVTMKEGFGFIRCTDRDGRMFFHYSELLDTEHELKLQQETDFCVVTDSTGRLVATRVRFLPKGTIAVEQYLPEKYIGTVEKEAGVTHSAKGLDPESPGIILYDVNGTKQTILFTLTSIDGTAPKLSEQVQFQICECRKNNTKSAVNVRVCSPSVAVRAAPVSAAAADKQLGFLASLDNNGGTIETADHENIITFVNEAGAVSDELCVGDEVEFSVTDKQTAKNVYKLKSGTISKQEILAGVLHGKVVRLCGESAEYYGQIQTAAVDKAGDEGAVTSYSFGVSSLTDKLEVLQKGDQVKFQLAVVPGSGKRFAVNVAAAKRYQHARIDSISRQMGFVTVEEEGKKVSFRLSDVLNGADVMVGDEMEFIVTQTASGRLQAGNVRKISDRQRPERLISRLKSVGDDVGPKMIVARQPRGPDGTRGFKQPRIPT